jgi:leucyl/phenylalanyl-tRNA--protein transferase
MFSWRDNASKVALVALGRRLQRWGFRVIDAQVATPHTLAMGAEEWERSRFLALLREELPLPTRRGCWTGDDPPLAER